jgi:hypothetical protein
MKNIYILPTDKPSILYAKDDNYKLANSTMAMDWYISSAGYKPYNIYITNDEEIKEGDWCLKVSSIYKGGGIIQKYSFIDAQFEDIIFKKIILTTDQELIKDGVQAIDDDFLEWFVKNPSCEEVEVDDKFLQSGYTYYRKNVLNNQNLYKIIIPKEEAKKETLEEFAKKQWGNVHRTGVLGFIEGAKWQQEQDKNKYSEEEVLEILNDCRGENPIDIDEWFEQIKKK